MPHTTRCLERIEQLQARVAERDKLLEQSEATIADLKRQGLEQQARVIELRTHLSAMVAYADLPAFESALKAERLAGKIEGLEDADAVVKIAHRNFEGVWEVSNELRRMAAELKEGK